MTSLAVGLSEPLSLESSGLLRLTHRLCLGYRFCREKQKLKVEVVCWEVRVCYWHLIEAWKVWVLQVEMCSLPVISLSRRKLL